jgi:hypothetical protein
MVRGLRLGAVVGGVLVAAVTQVLLVTLGAAIGLTAFTPAEHAQTEIQLGYAGWLVVSLFVSVFVGALVAAAGARSPVRRDGMLHGLVTWAAIGLMGFFLVGRNLEDLLGGAVRLAGRSAVAQAPTPEASRVVTEQSRAAEVRVTSEVEGRLEEVKGALAGGLQASRAVDDARQGMAIGLWSFLGVEVLLLIAALAGGALGAGRERRRVARAATTEGARPRQLVPPPSPA